MGLSRSIQYITIHVMSPYFGGSSLYFAILRKSPYQNLRISFHILYIPLFGISGLPQNLRISFFVYSFSLSEKENLPICYFKCITCMYNWTPIHQKFVLFSGVELRQGPIQDFWIGGSSLLRGSIYPTFLKIPHEISWTQRGVQVTPLNPLCLWIQHCKDRSTTNPEVRTESRTCEGGWSFCWKKK